MKDERGIRDGIREREREREKGGSERGGWMMCLACSLVLFIRAKLCN